MFLGQGYNKLRTGCVQSHRKCHQTSFPQRPSETICTGNFGCKSQSPRQSPHAEVRSAVRCISNASVRSECLYASVELRNVHDGGLVTDCGRSNILSDNG